MISRFIDSLNQIQNVRITSSIPGVKTLAVLISTTLPIDLIILKDKILKSLKAKLCIYLFLCIRIASVTSIRILKIVSYIITFSGSKDKAILFTLKALFDL
jgi:hypothetical protein